MTFCVLDASAALSWVLGDESSPEADSLLTLVVGSGATVPGLWPLEIANTLLVAERRGRITASDRHLAISTLFDLPIRVDPSTAVRAWTTTLGLAAERGLTVYDASYLELALREGLPLASGDRALRNTAQASGVTIV